VPPNGGAHKGDGSRSALTAGPPPFAETDHIRAALVLKLEDLLDDVVVLAGGEVRHRNSTHNVAIFGRNNGSLHVTLTNCGGVQRGSWHDFSDGTGGGPFDLIGKFLGLHSFPERLDWARQWLRWDTASKGTAKLRERAARAAEKMAQREAAQAADDAARLKVATEIWEASVHLGGTLGETYLQLTRGIATDVAAIPALRFNEKHQALVAAITTENGDFCGVQVIYLNEKNATKKGHPVTRGLLSKGYVRIPGSGDKVCFAEGLETGLSVWLATGHEVRCSLGLINVTRDALLTDRLMVVCADDDAPAQKAKARANWAATPALTLYPYSPELGQKGDFNDLLRNGGVAAIRARFASLDVGEAVGALQTKLGHAREILAARIDEFCRAAETFSGEEPPASGINVDLGAGKSHAAIHNLVASRQRMDEAGDDRTIVYAVPTHKLGGEIIRRFKEAGANSVEVWTGREWSDPETGETPMCGNTALVAKAREVRADIEGEVCAVCALKESCAYQAQKKRRAGIWVVPHQLLTTPIPEAMGKVAYAVIDESIWQKLIISGNVPLTLLDGSTEAPCADDGFLQLGRHAEIRSLARKALLRSEEGHLKREVFTELGLTAESCEYACRMEYRRLIETGPFMARKANKSVGTLALFWKALGGFLSESRMVSGQQKLVVRNDRLEVNTTTVTTFHTKIADVPKLLLDATMEPTLLREIVPNFQLIGSVRVETPYVRTVQLADKSFSKQTLEATRTLRNIRAGLVRVAAERGGRTLLVSNKAVISAMRELGLPEFVETAHFNAVAGRDGWKDVGTLFVIGRPSPRADSVERIAEAITGNPVQPLNGPYPQTDIKRKLRHRSGFRLVADVAPAHPDSFTELVRRQITESEVLQAVGRGRGVSRTADNPLLVIIATNVALDTIVDEVLPAETLTIATLKDQQIADGGFFTSNAAHAAVLHPGLYKSAEAAQKLFQRERGGGQTPLKNSLWKMSTSSLAGNLQSGTYQLAGSGSKSIRFLVDRRQIPDPRTYLEAQLGPLAAFEFDETPDAMPVKQYATVGVPCDDQELPKLPPAADAGSNGQKSHGLLQVLRDFRETALARQEGCDVIGRVGNSDPPPAGRIAHFGEGSAEPLRNWPKRPA